MIRPPCAMRLWRSQGARNLPLAHPEPVVCYCVAHGGCVLICKSRELIDRLRPFGSENLVPNNRPQFFRVHPPPRFNFSYDTAAARLPIRGNVSPFAATNV